MRAAKPRATCVPVSLWHEVQGCRLHAHAAGEGPAVVLIHGLGVSSAYFLPLAVRLACHFCVYALDLPGHGRSATPPRALDVPGLAQTLLGWVLIGPTPDPAAATAELLRRLVVDAAYERPGMIWQAFKDYLRMNVRVVPEYRAMLRHRFVEKLASVRVPALLVRGERDPIAPQRFVEDLARRLRAEVAIIPGWGHAVQHSAPEQVLQVVRPFLEALR